MKTNLCRFLVCLGPFLHASSALAQVGGTDGFADRVVIADTGDGTARWSVDASTATGFGDGVEDIAVLFGVVTDIHLLGDVNNDGITDKILVRDDGFGTWQWLADYSTLTTFGDGVPDETTLFGSSVDHIPVGFGDLNGDGFNDRFLVEPTPSFLVWIADYGLAGGSGDGLGDEFTGYGGPTHTPLGIVDVNNDGLTDRIINTNGAATPPSWAADFSTGLAPNGVMGDGNPDTQQGFGGPDDVNLLLGDMNNDGFADRVVVQTGGVLTEPNWVGDFTFAPLGFFGDGSGDIFQSATFGALADEFLLADIIDINGVSPIPGDFDSNTMVNGTDLPFWQTGYGIASGAAISDGDADFDGNVDGADFLLWQNNFGVGVPLLAPSAVPEPSSIAIGLVGLVLMFFRNRSKLD